MQAARSHHVRASSLSSSNPIYQPSARNNSGKLRSSLSVDVGDPSFRRVSLTQDDGIGVDGSDRIPIRVIHTRESSPQILAEVLRRRSVMLTTDGVDLMNYCCIWIKGCV